MTHRLEGSTALVTGANRGLGREIAAALLRAGARKVYAAARDGTGIESERIVPIRLDVTDKGHVADAVRRCADIDVLVNNAGLMTGTPALADDAEDALRREFEVNVMGLHAMMAAFAPVIERNGGGAIANMLSVVSWYTYPFNATYGASKRAALALTDGARIQLRGKRIGVTGVYAGFIDTDMASQVTSAKVAPRVVAQALLDGIRNGVDHVCADDFSRTVFGTMFADPARIEREMQAAWDAGAAWSH